MDPQFYILNSLSMIHRDLAYDLKDISGLSVSGYRVLLLIGDSKDGIRTTAIADALKLKFSSVAAVVETLAQRKLIDRSDDPHDKRIVHLSITNEGTELLEHIDKTLLGHLKKRWSQLNKHQLDRILIDLDRVHLTSEYITSVEIPYLDTEAILRKMGLSYTQFLILYQLEQKGTQRPKDLSAGLNHKPATVSLAMNGLERKGLIARSRSDNARSVMNIELTDEGRELLEESLNLLDDALSLRQAQIGYTNTELREFNIISKLLVSATAGETPS